jgi:hypothetical protein
MNLVVGLPRTQSRYDSLCVIVDQLAKVAHSVLVNMTYIGPQLAELYSSRIVCFHGVPMRIVSDRETQVILKFWERLHETLDTHWNFSSAYHPRSMDNRESKLDSRCYAESMCSAVWKKLE